MTLYRATSSGPVAMTEDEEAEFVEYQAINLIKSNQHDMLAYLVEIREIREQILNRIAGIGLTAIVSGDTALRDAVITGRQSLLDITSAPDVVAATDVAQLKTAVMAAYAVIVAACPDELKSAFVQPDR